MSHSLPETEEEMLKIVGVTKANFEKYGRQLLEITQEAAANKFGKIILIFNWRISYVHFLQYLRHYQVHFFFNNHFTISHLSFTFILMNMQKK